MRILAAILFTAVTALAQFRAGAAMRSITPDLAKLPAYLAGFGQNRRAASVHDEISARCVAFAVERTVVVCAVDVLGLFLEDIQNARDSANDRLPQPADIIVAATGTHSAPDTLGLWGPARGQTGLNEEYNLFVVDRIAEAAVEAVHSLRPATLRLATMHDQKLDGFPRRSRPPKVLDSDMVVLTAVDNGGRTIATVVNWAGMPETLGPSNTAISADYAGALCGAVERYAGGIAVFLNGAAGAEQPPDPLAAAESFRRAEGFGKALADAVVQAQSSTTRDKITAVHYREAQVDIPVKNPVLEQSSAAGIWPLSADGHSSHTVVGRLWITGSHGPLLDAVTVPGELYPELSVGGTAHLEGADFPDAAIEPPLKTKLMTASFRMVVGMANDEIGQILPEAEWDEKEPWLERAPKPWGGESDSLGPEAAPRITAGLASLFQYR